MEWTQWEQVSGARSVGDVMFRRERADGDAQEASIIYAYEANPLRILHGDVEPDFPANRVTHLCRHGHIGPAMDNGVCRQCA